MPNPQQVSQAPVEQPNEIDEEESFRNSIDDTIVILEAIGPLCTDIDELIGMLRLAVKNSSQLNLILKQVRPIRLKERNS